MAGISIDLLNQLLTYDPSSGIFRWRVDAAHNVRAGDTAAKKGKKKYLQIGINQKTYLAHRIAWAMHTGEWPKRLIDHKNGDAHDNRIGNLREATYSQNAANRPTPVTSRSGVKGVRFKSGAWEASLEKDSKTVYLGRFACLGRAATAYRLKAQSLFGDFASGGRK